MILDPSRVVPFSSVYLVPSFFLVFGSPLVAIGVRAERANAAEKNWPRAKGKILTSAVRTVTAEIFDSFDKGRWANSPSNQGQMRSVTTITAEATYTYEVDGQTHEGTKVNREGIGGSQQEMQAWVDAHPPGTEVTVYVDPQNPATAYLQLKRWSVGGLILLIWGGVMIFIGLLVLVIFMLN
ncbi:MAG: DUF3592 domain-containing protein [Polyangiaceae bacterium]